MVTTPTPFSIAEVSSISGECGNGSTSSGPVDIGYPDRRMIRSPTNGVDPLPVSNMGRVSPNPAAYGGGRGGRASQQ